MIIQLIYNSCMCPLSYFIRQSELIDLEILAEIDTVSVTQPVDQQRDHIN